MKVTHESHDRLCLQDRPWVLLVGFGLLCAVFGYAAWKGQIPGEIFPWPFLLLPPIAFTALLYYYEHLHVTFDRTNGLVRLRRRRLMRTTDTMHALNALVDIKVIGTGDLEGGTNRIALYFEDLDEPVPLTFYETNAASVSTTAARIKDWLERG